MVENIIDIILQKRVEIVINGSVVASLSKRFASLEVKDEMGALSDELTLVIPGDFMRPKGDDEISLLIDGIDYGTYTVQETTKTFQSLTIKARAANFSKSLKEKKSRAFDKMKLCKIVGKIATEHAMKQKCDVETYIDHVAQNGESDLNLLTRIAKKHNLDFSIKANTIMMLQKGSTMGRPMFIIRATEAKSYRIKHTTKQLYGACEAMYHDTKKNKVKRVKVGSGTPVLTLTGSYKNEANANEAAKAALANITSGTIEGSVTIPGREMRAGGILTLAGFKEDDGIYTIKRVSHRIDQGGYVVRVDFEKA